MGINSSVTCVSFLFFYEFTINLPNLMPSYLQQISDHSHCYRRIKTNGSNRPFKLFQFMKEHNMYSFLYISPLFYESILGTFLI